MDHASQRIQDKLWYGILPNAAPAKRPGPPHAKTEPTFQHDIYRFLQADDALRLRALEEQVNQGKVNIIELYRAAEGTLKAEQGKR
jgi:hypothetical protein